MAVDVERFKDAPRGGAPPRGRRHRVPAQGEPRLDRGRDRGRDDDNNIAETATATLDREIDYTLEENSEHVLAEIDGALKRIEEGTYGICVNCGKPIAEERLTAIPWATYCIDCKRLVEGR